MAWYYYIHASIRRFLFSVVLSDSLSMPNYISTIFIANIFARRRVRSWLKRNVLCRTLSPYLAARPQGFEGDLPRRTLFQPRLYLARLKFRRKSPPYKRFRIDNRGKTLWSNNCYCSFLIRRETVFDLTAFWSECFSEILSRVRKDCPRIHVNWPNRLEDTPLCGVVYRLFQNSRFLTLSTRTDSTRTVPAIFKLLI